jgi:hypothetical protein
MRGMSALAAYDMAYNTSHVKEFLQPFLNGMETEFTNAAGTVIPLRSSVTGIPLPFPGADSSYSSVMNTYAPARARTKWALGAAEIQSKLQDVAGVTMLDLPDDGIDFGNYKRGGLTLNMAVYLATAREFGDALIADAAFNTLEHRCGRTLSEGVLSYSGGSNMANALVLMGRIARRNTIRDLFNQPREPGTLTGPLLTGAQYPDVLVARAYSRGDDLDLVLYGTHDGSQQQIGLSRLAPGSRYVVDGRPDLAFKADDRGGATLNVTLSGRTHLHIRPS